MSLEVLSQDGSCCFNYGVNENGQAECYWPDCGCTPAARKTAFLAAARGIAGHIVARAMNSLCSPIQVNWHGCSKTYMAESFATGGTTQSKDGEFLRRLTLAQFRDALGREGRRA